MLWRILVISEPTSSLQPAVRAEAAAFHSGVDLVIGLLMSCAEWEDLLGGAVVVLVLLLLVFLLVGHWLVGGSDGRIAQGD